MKSCEGIGVQVRQRRPRRRKIGIELQRPLQVLGCAFEIRSRATLVDRFALQIQCVGFGVGRPRGARCLPFQQRYLQCRNHRPGDFILHLEDVVHRPVVGIRPEVIPVIRTN